MQNQAVLLWRRICGRIYRLGLIRVDTTAEVP
jgi:hypothetical protein